MGGETVGKNDTCDTRHRWKDNIKADLTKMNTPMDMNLLENRETWRNIVQSAMTHPGLIYCKNCHRSKRTPREKVEHAYYHPTYRTSLYNDLMYDMNKTSWFQNEIPNENRFIEPYYVHKIFVSTGSGLTRWKTFNSDTYQNIYGEAEPANDRSTDEDWYQRTVEENFKNEDMFIYSVPFEISGNCLSENQTQFKVEDV
ncbi:hypothetical protein YQE_05722, partial [Dendroctonus ponderosae]